MRNSSKTESKFEKLSVEYTIYVACEVPFTTKIFEKNLVDVSLYAMHCKDTIPKIRNKYSQKRNCAASVPNSIFICLWAIYIVSHNRSAYSAAGKYVEWSWEYINRSQTWKWGTKAAQFLFWEYINWIFVAVWFEIVLKARLYRLSKITIYLLCVYL